MAPVGGDGPATRAAAVSCSYRRCRVDEGSPTVVRGTKLSKQLAILRRERTVEEGEGGLPVPGGWHRHPQGTGVDNTPTWMC